MGKIANVSDNLPQKLTLAIKSGKHKIGKLRLSLLNIFRLQARPQAAQSRHQQAYDHCQQLPSC
jgi:hypothetical protein